MRRAMLIALGIFALVNDFHNWPRWQSQDRKDPSVVRTYSGAGSGLGAKSEWHGKSSAGRQEITASSAPSEIVVKVDFAKPFQAHNINTFSFAQSGSGTTVTWTMRGTNVYPAKVMSVFVNMGAVMGRHFEDGLRNLKAESEK